MVAVHDDSSDMHTVHWFIYSHELAHRPASAFYLHTTRPQTINILITVPTQSIIAVNQSSAS